MIIISPSLLSCDILNLEKEIKYFDQVKNFWFHLDIMDGHFVPNLTFGHPVVSLLAKKTNQRLDAHFMVNNPNFYVETFKDYNIFNFTFHIESTETPKELLDFARRFYPSVGISIRPSTSMDNLSDDLLKKIDLLLVMAVEPGFSGQSFLEETYERLNEIKEIKARLGAKFMVQVDGGVTDINARKLIEHGANNLVSGSYIFKDGPSHYLEKLERLR
jgi:ribulose-phosphate 3-epimerase